jgi:hypothetical protein
MSSDSNLWKITAYASVSAMMVSVVALLCGTFLLLWRTEGAFEVEIFGEKLRGSGLVGVFVIIVALLLTFRVLDRVVKK